MTMKVNIMGDLSKKSVEELKVMAYDAMAVLERDQRTLQIINAEIAKKLTPTKENKK